MPRGRKGTMEQRIAKWDNLKFWMILCVVTGHVIYQFHGTSFETDALYLFIYSFHMPVFMFVAGLFSKNAVKEKRYELIVEYLAIYVIMKFTETLGNYIATGKSSFHFLWESGPAWFALAMAVFLFVTMLLKDYRPPVILALAVMIGCFAGLDTHFGDHFASMRICVFYPVFLAGFYMEPKAFDLSNLTKTNRIIVKAASLAVLVIVCFLAFRYFGDSKVLIRLFKGKYEYAEMGMRLDGVVWRMLCYAFWGVMIPAVIFLTDGKERIYTWLGSRSMSVFIWHNLAIAIVIRATGLRRILMVNMPNYYLIGAVCIAGVITVLTAYLPGFRISKKLRARKRGDGIPEASEQ